MATLCSILSLKAQEPISNKSPQKQTIKGKVISAANGEALIGAIIKNIATSQNVISDSNGEFTLTLPNGHYTLAINYLGYKPQTISIQVPLKKLLIITLEVDEQSLREVEIVSTGYQDIPKERATGSFTQIGAKTLNRNVGINILDRLEGITNGLLVNKNLNGNNAKISIRGRSTIFANTNPLIVLDGFPYEGTIEQINPADVETINILKDAAAASIWGTRAGNGVIILTSKKGQKNKQPAIEVSSTLSISDKPDLYYKPQISSTDYIDLEAYLFSKGAYASSINRSYAPISIAVEIFNSRKNKQITAADSAAQINLLKTNDIRKDLERYAYRNSSHQQYQLNLSGGGENNLYYISGGYDKSLENLITNSYDRLTLNANNSFSFFKDRLELTSNLSFTNSHTNTKSDSYVPYSPYERLADNNGNSLPSVKNLRLTYAEKAGNGKLLDWLYRPKDELVSNTLDQLDQYKIKVGLKYKLVDNLYLDANYQFLREKNSKEINRDLNSYYTRDQINQYSSISDDLVSRVIPLGNIVSTKDIDLTTKIIRFQLNYNKKIATDHEFNVIAGYEGGDERTNNLNLTLYGYDPETKGNGNETINPLISYPLFYRPAVNQKIPLAPYQNQFINITQSYYVNASYSYLNRYILSGSSRRDESNLFGVNANQKGVPLWSVGFAWIINQLPYLKLRATYGYNGNVDKTTSGYLTATTGGLINEWGSEYSLILNPPNPALRWEKVKTWNLGLDFSLKNNRINGSIEAYKKDAMDLIGNSPIAMQSGLTEFKGNGANLQTKGIDLILNTRNIVNEFQWATTFILNFNTDKITSYKIKQASNFYIVQGNYQNPLQGYPYNAVYSFPSAGLDATGNPQGYLNGVASKDYSAITGLLDPSQIKYHGSASPKYFGSLINTFYYKQFELSFNILYKLGYYFRRGNVFTGGANNLSYTNLGNFEDRWKKPGDELITKIPSLIYPNNNQRQDFFQYSEDLVERGDHIRLQDLRLSYHFWDKTANSILKKAQLFLYAKNLGILWRKNSLGIDPDYGTSGLPQSLSCSIGINFNL
jgi:TonB-linked SusC/RagA family outer membrane protein